MHLEPSPVKFSLSRCDAEGATCEDFARGDSSFGPTATASTHSDTRAEDGAFSEKPSSPRLDSLQLYLNEIGRVPLLKPQEEVALAHRIRAGDLAARTRMITANLRLVVRIARDYARYGLTLLDLIAEGNVGLIKAVERFDPDKGGKLSTYAAWWIKQSIKRALANQSKTIRLPVHLLDRISRMRRVDLQLQARLGREATASELAQEMGLPVRKIALLMQVSVQPASLDACVGNEEPVELCELVADENAPTPFECLRGKTMSHNLKALMAQLKPRETEILRMRYGLDGEPIKTLEHIGASLGLTRERIRQLQNIALRKLRRALLQLEHQNSLEEACEEQVKQERIASLQAYIGDEKIMDFVHFPSQAVA